MVFQARGNGDDAKEHRAHFKRHGAAGRCLRCTWGRNMAAWLPELPAIRPEWASQIHDANPSLSSSWVQVKQNESGKYSLRCIACPLYKVRPGTAVHLRWLRQHHESRRHIRLMQRLLGLATGPTGLTMVGAPSAEEFLRIWKSSPHNLEEVGSMEKWHACVELSRFASCGMNQKGSC
jgi:hypothetical protein